MSREPSPIAIKLRASGGVRIDWSDGHQGTYPYGYLRSNCPCAGCENRPPASASWSRVNSPSWARDHLIP